MINTNTEWCDITWSPWLGCSKVSEGCKNCYIVTTMPFLMRGLKHGMPRERTSEAYWRNPLVWDREVYCGKCDTVFNSKKYPYDCPSCGKILQVPRWKVFPSLCDWLDDEVPIEWLADFLKLIYETPNLDWLLLTKRPENFFERMHGVMTNMVIRKFDSRVVDWAIRWRESESIPYNLWFGVSVENQETADKRIPELLAIPAKVRFLSCEPLLGKIEFPWQFNLLDRKECGLSDDPLAATLLQNAMDEGLAAAPTLISWVIVGGESGTDARPCNIAWIRTIAEACQKSQVPCFVKQLGSRPILGREDSQIIRHKKGGETTEWPSDLRVREFPEVSRRGAEGAEVGR